MSKIIIPGFDNNPKSVNEIAYDPDAISKETIVTGDQVIKLDLEQSNTYHTINFAVGLETKITIDPVFGLEDRTLHVVIFDNSKNTNKQTVQFSDACVPSGRAYNVDISIPAGRIVYIIGSPINNNFNYMEGSFIK